MENEDLGCEISSMAAGAWSVVIETNVHISQCEGGVLWRPAVDSVI